MLLTKILTLLFFGISFSIPAFVGGDSLFFDQSAALHSVQGHTGAVAMEDEVLEEASESSSKGLDPSKFKNLFDFNPKPSIPLFKARLHCSPEIVKIEKFRTFANSSRAPPSASC